MNRRNVQDVAVLVGLLLAAFGSRLVMFEPNFHAVTAASLFAGFYFRSRLVAACVPLLAMTMSNWFIGGYTREVMFVVYAALLVPIAWRAVLRHRLTPAHVAAASVSSSLVFYLATNAAVWHAGLWYPATLEGLARCYAAGLPFLANALAGDLTFSAVLFGAYALAVHMASVGHVGSAGERLEAAARVAA